MRTAELRAHYWENATLQQKKTLYSRVAAVFDKAVGDPWREAWADVDGVVAPWLNRLVGAYYRGDYRTVARALGEGQGYVGSQVTLNIAAAEIGNRLLEELPRLQAAFKEVGDTTRTFRTLRERRPGRC